jgi:hypothetical protein
VFKKKDRERSVEGNNNTDVFSNGGASLTNLKHQPQSPGLPKKVDQYFPLDVAYRRHSKQRNLLFRMDVQEYQVDEGDLKGLLSHIL